MLVNKTRCKGTKSWAIITWINIKKAKKEKSLCRSAISFIFNS